jgi:cysteine desulfurase
MTNAVYLDAAASTPIAPEALAAMTRVLERGAGNPNAAHEYGHAAAREVMLAREHIAGMFGIGMRGVVFTGSATEANNLVLRGLTVSEARGEIVATVTEHDSIAATLRDLRRSGRTVHIVGVTPSGEVDLDGLREVLSPRTALVTVHAANNETGVVQPIPAIAALAHESGALVHSDASQYLVWGDTRLLADVDFVTASSHKMHGPQGAGALIAAEGARSRLTAQITGGGHEQGLRSGTPNIAAIAGFGAAVTLAASTGSKAATAVRALRYRLLHGLREAVHGVVEHGCDAGERLPGILNVAVGTDDPESVESEVILARTPQVAASTGSAPEPSAVLRAMGLSDWEAARSLRLSLSRYSTTDEVDRAVAHLAASIQSLDELLGGDREPESLREVTQV